MAAPFRRKQNRLSMEVYYGARVYSLTLACHNRRRRFTRADFIEHSVEALKAAAQKHNSRVYAYCFMPDHLHLLVQGGPRTFLPDFVHDFKQTTAYSFRELTGGRLWQDGYYDHILRSEEGVRAVARYIAGNPVRAGIVLNAADYPYTGSLDWDRASLVEA